MIYMESIVLHSSWNYYFVVFIRKVVNSNWINGNIHVYNNKIRIYKYYHVKNFISLLLAIGSYIWECIIWSPKNLEKFIRYGGVYVILDLIEIVPYCSRCLFLAVFTDMCDNFFCGPFLCTWRATDKRTGLMSLLAKIWREEEIRIEVKRNVDGTVKGK